MNATGGMMQGKVALVSGGAEGIGGATGRRIVEEGGSVVLADGQFDKAKALASELGERAMAVSLDVRDLKHWEAAVQAAQATFGKLTHLVNVAGISEPGSVVDVDLDSWQRTIDINLNGTFNGCRVAIPAIAAANEPGAIVNIGSMLALRVGSGFAAYCASKAGLHGLTRAVAIDHGNDQIRCNAIAPGWIDTELNEAFINSADDPEGFRRDIGKIHPLGKTGTPEEVAALAAFLAAEESSFITGQIFTVDGGRMAKLSLP